MIIVRHDSSHIAIFHNTEEPVPRVRLKGSLWERDSPYDLAPQGGPHPLGDEQLDELVVGVPIGITIMAPKSQTTVG